MIRPLHDWILVEVEQFDQKSSIIEFVINETNVRKGVVIAVGPKVKDLKVGEKVAYIRWHEEHRPGKQTIKAIRELSDEHGKDVATIRVADILFAYDGDVRVDVLWVGSLLLRQPSQGRSKNASSMKTPLLVLPSPLSSPPKRSSRSSMPLPGNCF